MWFFGKKQKKSDVSLDLNDHRYEVESHCFISGNVSVHGEVQFAGTLRVDGRIDGKVTNYPGKQGTLIVSKGAFVNGPVETTNVICDGSIRGDVNVEQRLEVRANGIVRGEMYYNKLTTMDGAQLIGRCHQKNTGVKLESVGSPSFTTGSLATRESESENIQTFSLSSKRRGS